MPEGLITLPEAARRASITRMAMIGWCKKYNIGKKTGGRWDVNEKKLAQLLKSRDEVLNG